MDAVVLQAAVPGKHDHPGAGGREHERPRIVVPGDSDDGRAEAREAGNDGGLVLRAALGEVADHEDRPPGCELFERRQDEAVRMEIGGDDDRAVDRRRVSALLAGDGDELREPRDGVAVRALVALAVREQSLREVEQPRELVAVRVERRLA